MQWSQHLLGLASLTDTNTSRDASCNHLNKIRIRTCKATLAEEVQAGKSGKSGPGHSEVDVPRHGVSSTVRILGEHTMSGSGCQCPDGKEEQKVVAISELWWLILLASLARRVEIFPDPVPVC